MKKYLNLVGVVVVGFWMITNIAKAQGIPTYDNMANIRLILTGITELDQLAQQTTQTIQQLTDYRLQLQNLQSLPGTVRSQVQSHLVGQLQNTVGDYGASNLNGLARINPSATTYYDQAGILINNEIGVTPVDTNALNQQLQQVGIDPANSAVGKNNTVTRNQYLRTLDDMRQVALSRQNSQNRAVVANNIATQMTNLPANNTVGAIQLLGAQNSLTYAQQEELLKTLSLQLKNMQEQQLREISEDAENRAREMKRLKKLQADPLGTQSNGVLQNATLE